MAGMTQTFEMPALSLDWPANRKVLLVTVIVADLGAVIVTLGFTTSGVTVRMATLLVVVPDLFVTITEYAPASAI
jgi:hypothetical protein